MQKNYLFWQRPFWGLVFLALIYALISVYHYELYAEVENAESDDSVDVELNEPQTFSPQGPILSLNDCIALGLRQKKPELAYHLDIYKGQVMSPGFNYFPRIQIEELIAPLPENGFSDWGVHNRLKITAGFPIYDFGRTNDFLKASKNRLEVEEKGNELIFGQEVIEIVQLYYGVLLGQESLNILTDANGKLLQYQEQLEKRYEKRAKGVSRADVLNMRYEVLLMEERISDAQGKLDDAFSALAMKMGFDSNEFFGIEDRFLRPLSYELGKLEEYQDLAVQNRAEVQMLEKGLVARKALILAEKKGYMPSFFLGGFVENGVASVREFDDNFNFTTGGFGLALKWNIDWPATQGKVKVANAEYNKLLAQQHLALPAIQLDVTRAYREAARMKEKVERGKKSRKIGRALLFFAKSNWDIGIGDPVQLKDALIRFNEARFNHLRSVFDFNVAVAKLSKSVGEDLGVFHPRI